MIKYIIENYLGVSWPEKTDSMQTTSKLQNALFALGEVGMLKELDGSFNVRMYGIGKVKLNGGRNHGTPSQSKRERKSPNH